MACAIYGLFVYYFSQPPGSSVGGPMQQAQHTPGQQIEAAMLDRARATVLQDNCWLTSKQVAELAGLRDGSASTELGSWTHDRLIFSISAQGIELFPAYGLDHQNSYHPLPEISKIIETLGQSKDGWGLAYWFASANSFIGGRRPQDLLVMDPEAVVAAAADEADGFMHG